MLSFIIPQFCHFTVQGQENKINKYKINMPMYYTVQSRFDRCCAEGGRSKNTMNWNNKPLIRCFGRYARTFYSLLASCKISAHILHQNNE